MSAINNRQDAEYKNIKANLKEQIKQKQLAYLCLLAQNILNTIDQSSEELSYRSEILKLTNALLICPDLPETQKRYHELIKKECSGAPHAQKKWVGACVAFLGAVLFTVSLAATICSGGVLGELGIPGMALGAFLMAIGIRTYNNGVHRGLSKNLFTFYNNVKALKSSDSDGMQPQRVN